MKKYLDILLFALLFFFIFSYFSGEKTSTPLNGILFETSKTSYKVPAGVELNIINNTASTFSFNPCENISLRKSGKLIDIPTRLCKEISLNSRESRTLDFTQEYTLFEEVGNYTFSLNKGQQEYISQMEIKYRGTIGKLFVGLFYAPIYNLMAYLIQFFGNSLGWAIVAITILIRVLLLFPQHKMMVSQRKMQAIQPKIKKLQEKHKGNQQQIGVELMKLYKKEGVNPMGSCGFLLIQMPILLVIYRIIMNITSLTNEFYLYDFLPVFHVSQLSSDFFGIQLLESGGIIGIVLALAVAGIQFIQVKLSLANKTNDTKKIGLVLEKKKGETDYKGMMPDPEMMNKFMLYGMPAMIGVFTYTVIAGVGFYWGVSTLFAIAQQLFVNKIIKSK